MSHPFTNFNVASQAEYKISVMGFLEDSYSDRLGGLSIQATQYDQQSGKLITILRGQVVDQAALLGVLNTLYNMRMPLLSVECLEINQTKE